MSIRKNANEDSPDLPGYLSIADGKYYKASPLTQKSFHPTKKYFPTQKYGVSPDAPSEFQTKYSKVTSLMLNSVLSKDPAMNQDSDKKILTKDLIREWPMRSIQTYDINEASVPHKFETKPAKTRELYDCIKHEKKVIERPDLVVGEETLYTKKFYEALKDSKAFNRKAGYFGQFSKHHKTNNEEIKLKRSDSQGHSRYISKPIMFTSLNTRNNLATKLSKEFPGQNDDSRSSCSPQPRTEDSPRKSVVSQETSRASKQIIPLKKIFKKAQVSARSPSPVPVKKAYTICLRKGSLAADNGIEPQPLDLENLKIVPNTYRIITRRSDSVQPTTRRQALPTEQSQGQEDKVGVSLEIEKSLLKQDTLRFKTREATQAISESREKLIRGDPEVYIKHGAEADYRRYSSIEISVAEKSKRHARNYDGEPIRYTSVPKRKEGRKEVQGYSVNDNIQKFEKHIDGLRKTSVNFGHQRWFYNNEWKLERLETFEDSPRQKEKAVKN